MPRCYGYQDRFDPEHAESNVVAASRLLRAFHRATLRHGEAKRPGTTPINLFRQAIGDTQGVSEADWRVLMARWPDESTWPGRPGEGAHAALTRLERPRLEWRDSSQEVVSLVRRETSGSYTEDRLSVWRMLQLLVGHRVEARLLSEWYLRELREQHCLSGDAETEEAILSVVEELKVSMVKGSGRIVFPGETQSGRDRSVRMRQGILESLENMGIILRDHKESVTYVAKLEANPAYVISSLTMAGSGTNLDFILYGGGMRTPVEWVKSEPAATMGAAHSGSGCDRPGMVLMAEPTTTVIRAGAGLGKTSLALTLAAFVAARSKTSHVIYLHHEASESTLLRQLRLLASDHLRFVDVVTQGEIGRRNHGFGRIEFVQLTRGAKELVDETMETMVKRLLPKEGAGRSPADNLVVFDSIPLKEAESGGWNRERMHDWIYRFAGYGFRTLWLVEQDEDGAGSGETFADFLADVVLRLRRQPQVDQTLEERTIEITKNRGGAIHGGRHRYLIDNEGGFRVLPSCAAILESIGNRGDRQYFRSAAISMGIENASWLLSAPEAVKEGDRVAFLSEGSTTVLQGRRGTGKTAFARAFCRGERQGAPQSALCVYFSDADRPGWETVQRDAREPFCHGFKYQQRLGGMGKDGRGSLITHLWFRAGFLTPEEVLWSLREVLHSSRQRFFPIRRAMVSDMANLPSAFPLLTRDFGFLPALREMLRAEGITAVFVNSQEVAIGQVGRGGGELSEQLEALSENVIQFMPVPHLGAHRVWLHVVRSANSLHNRGYVELVRQAGGAIRLAPVAGSYVQTRDGGWEAIDIGLSLCGRSDKHAELLREFVSQSEAADDIQVSVDRDAVRCGRRRVLEAGLSERARPTIYQVNDSDVTFAKEHQNREFGLTDFRQYRREFGDGGVFANRTNHFDSDGGAGFFAPFLLDPPVLELDDEFASCLERRKLRGESIAGQVLQGAGDYRWEDLASLADDEVARLGKEDLGLLDPGGDAESLNCLFLELLSAEIGFPCTRLLRSSGQRRLKGGRPLEEAVKGSLRLLRRLFAGPAYETRPGGGRRAMLRRAWYSEVAAEPQSRRWICLPAPYWASGDWYFCIKPRGTAERRAVQFTLERLVSERPVRELWRRGAGLPPYLSEYEHAAANVAGPRLELRRFRRYARQEDVIFRSAIPHYQSTSGDLSVMIEDALGGEDARLVNWVTGKRLGPG